LRLLVQFQPDLIAIAALIIHHVSYPKGGCTKDQKAKNTHLAPPQAVADAKCGTVGYINTRLDWNEVTYFNKGVADVQFNSENNDAKEQAEAFWKPWRKEL
jgi:hypothetical protein